MVFIGAHAIIPCSPTDFAGAPMSKYRSSCSFGTMSYGKGRRTYGKDKIRDDKMVVSSMKNLIPHSFQKSCFIIMIFAIFKKI
jgi:hypothetical protein